MPSKKKPWTDDEIVLLSAYLDYFVEKRKGLGKWSLEDVLPKLEKHIKMRSSKQIETKLYSLWGGYDANIPKAPFQDVFKHGSRCLKWLKTDLRPRVEAELLIIRDSELSQSLETPQTLRSGRKRSTSIDIRRHTPYRDTTEPETPTKPPSRRLRRPALLQSSPTVDGQRRGVSEVISTLSTSSSFRAVKIEIPAKYDMRSPLSRDPADINGIPALRDIGREIADSFESIADAVREDPTTHSLGSGTRMTKRILLQLNDFSHADPLDHKRLINSPSAIQRSKAQEIYGMLHDLVNDNTRLRRENSNLARKQADYQTEVRRLLESVDQLSSETPDWSTFSVIQQQDRIIAERDRSLRDQAYLQPFLDCRHYRDPLDLRKIEDAFRSTKSAMAELREFQCSSSSILQCESEDLATLVERALGHTSQRMLLKQKSSQLAKSRLSSLILQSLVGAAICEWIFLPELYCAAILPTPLLETYRFHLRSLCGNQGLANLDLAALRSIIKDEGFREIYLSGTAARLAERFFASLKVISVSNKVTFQEEDIKQKLRNVFFHALVVKYEVMICKDKFDIIWPALSSPFERSSMDFCMLELDGAARTRAEEGLARVELVIVPGLHRYTDKKSLDDTPFFTAGEVRIGKPTLVSRALVSLV